LKSVGPPPAAANHEDTPSNHADIKVSPKSNRPTPSKLDAVFLMAGSGDPLLSCRLPTRAEDGF
jgi:hypothetical protein